jgi:pimeloyl-ACP methyl ester carboxylesterase
MVSAGRVRTAGLEVAYDQAGSGQPLVLVHGAAGDAREWHLQIAGLSDDFRVIAWDEPGAGRSWDVPAGFGLAGYATASVLVRLALSRLSGHRARRLSRARDHECVSAGRAAAR